ncbi:MULTISPECIES: hypothetical protein [Vreelandella]|jgi:hypothetical protein|uniref:Uncharacterized protein n=1 Tax=Vreelandella gomseomensis TaxID=370766 RepID=A0ABU1G8A4_9GAMM|nr:MULTISPECIES: hypothetical protein [Halomonas]MDR5873715.1 hypothetical protein [Halomonas gomseomensis]MDR5884972.1 hypothetical protein [Halomonas janggokensis]
MISFKGLAATAALLVFPALVLAHGDQGPWQGHGPGMMMDQEQMQQMHQNWSHMNQLMQRIPDEASPQERQRLMREHREAMQEQMNFMHRGMMGPGMMQGQSGMMGGQHMMNGGQPKNGDGLTTEKQIQMMQERMDQMQLMMEQMLQYQKNLNVQ